MPAPLFLHDQGWSFEAISFDRLEVLSMKSAYACNCIYWADASNKSIYADIYLNFVKDLEEGSYLHLAVVVAKENGCVVSACADCIGKIVEKTSELPEYPENIDRVCNRFCFCYTNIWLLFSKTKELKKCSRRSVIPYLLSSRHTRDIYNNCMKCFIMPLKSIPMPYVIDEH